MRSPWTAHFRRVTPLARPAAPVYTHCVQAPPLYRWLGSVRDLLLPHHCECCRAPAQRWLCDGCHDEFDELLSQSFCPVCAYPLLADGDPCPKCLGKAGKVVQRVATLGIFKGPLRQLIHRLKYEHQWRLTGQLARHLLARPGAQSLLAEADILIPVPLFWRRRLARRFNQADLLARELAGPRRLPVLHTVWRHRETDVQALLRSVAARTRNVRRAFRATPDPRLTGKRILLVDDVMTTGATLRAVARALAFSQPAAVNALVLAIADPRNHDFSAV